MRRRILQAYAYIAEQNLRFKRRLALWVRRAGRVMRGDGPAGSFGLWMIFRARCLLSQSRGSDSVMGGPGGCGFMAADEAGNYDE